MVAALVALAPDWQRYLILQGEVFLASGELARSAACYQRAIEAATRMKGELAGRAAVVEWGWGGCFWFFFGGGGEGGGWWGGRT